MSQQTGCRILMTEGTSLSARQSLYALGPNHAIDILDPSPMCQCRFSGLVRRWYRSPSYARQPAEFLEFLVERLQTEEYDVLLPTHEQVFLLSRYRHSLQQLAGLALPEFDSLLEMHNKAHFMRLLSRLEIPIPRTEFITELSQLEEPRDYPCYLKLAHSTAGCGVFRVANQAELVELGRSHVERLRAGEGSEVLIQQPARGVQATVQAVFQQGRLVGAHSFEARRLGVGGMSTARVSADHPVVLGHVEQLGRELDWHGSTFIDYFFDAETGQPEYIEANPRIGETVNAQLSGLNLPQLLVDVSRGVELPTVEPVCTTQVGVRTQSFMMILISAALEGGTRGQLWSELRAYQRSRGLYESSQDELCRRREDRLSVLPLFWIATQLLAWPRLSEKIVASTIDNYSLPVTASQSVEQLSSDFIEQVLAKFET